MSERERERGRVRGLGGTGRTDGLALFGFSGPELRSKAKPYHLPASSPLGLSVFCPSPSSHTNIPTDLLLLSDPPLCPFHPTVLHRSKDAAGHATNDGSAAKGLSRRSATGRWVCACVRPCLFLPRSRCLSLSPSVILSLILSSLCPALPSWRIPIDGLDRGRTRSSAPAPNPTN